MSPQRCSTTVAAPAGRLWTLLLTISAAALAADLGTATGACAPGAASGSAECRAAEEDHERVALLQHALRVDRHGRVARDEAPSCAALTNHETDLTVKVGVGTPPQYFDTIADTGSDDLVIPSCSCATCPSTDACFDASKSPTASLSNEELFLSYGSGDIETVAATDVVNVGGATAKLDDGVLLMMDRQLDISGPFEGLLGLGVPKENPAVPMFLPGAGVQRFSVCYQNEGGALELDVPALPESMEQIGTLHWGLGVWGISVGSAEIPVLACGEDSMTYPGQQTPCGAITDSGTTALMGPESQILSMLASLCDGWDRCAAATKGASEPVKAQDFQILLLECDLWLSDDEDLGELPSIFWKLGGDGGAEQTIELTPWSYVTTMSYSAYVSMMSKDGSQNSKAHWSRYNPPLGRNFNKAADTKVCMPDFGVYDYPTSTNGYVWIMGLPLFYQYKVHFDQTSPMKIGFSTEACELCEVKASKSKAALLTEKTVPLSGNSSSGLHHATRRKLRKVSKPLRMPDFNRSLPL